MNNSKKITKKNGKHLTLDERITIQSLLDKGVSPLQISKDLNKSPSTITREIHKHMVTTHEVNKCEHFLVCRKMHICGLSYCKLICKNCNKGYCGPKCSNYQPFECRRSNKSFHICNECEYYKQCPLEKNIYKAAEANKDYKDKLVNSRVGFDLSEEEIETIDKLASPLIKSGHSPYAVTKEVGEKLPCSESTLYRLIDQSKLSARNIDLSESVTRRQRKHHKLNNKDAYSIPSKAKVGHLYEDYLDYIKDHPVCPQMDCVEGKQNENATLLTLHWPKEHMQLYFIMDKQTSKNVVATLDKIEETIGTALFVEMFPAILTDNGHEFADIEGMERSCLHPGQKRTYIYFCEPNRSDEKGAAERNHKLLRRIVPKGSSLEVITQVEATLITNHVNSYVRKALGGICPYDEAMEKYDEDFFILLGLERIKSSEVIMTPDLLK